MKMISTLEEFKWLVLASIANEASFWAAHSAENSEKVAQMFEGVADFFFKKMKEVNNGNV